MPTVFVALLTLALQVPGGAGQPSTSAALAGVVTALGTGRPVTRAEVRLLDDQGRVVASVDTDAAGRFALDPLDPGRYRLTASRDGYVAAEYGQRRAGRPGQALDIQPGARRTDLAIQMTPTGVISGSVRDIYGEPVVNANVEALQFRYQGAQRTLGAVQHATTNDLGEYRLFWMQPGEYVVRVGASPSSGNFIFTQAGNGAVAYRITTNTTDIVGAPGLPPPPPPGTDAPRLLSFLADPAAAAAAPSAPIYYPGTTDASQALTIDLAAGTEFPRVDMILTEAPLAKLGGHVLDPVTGTVPQGTTVSLRSRADIFVEGSQRRAPVGEDGTFEIDAVLPGMYDLTASVGGTTRNVRITSVPGGERTQVIEESTTEPLYARLPLDIRPGAVAIENLVLELAPGFDLTGRVRPPVGESVDLATLNVNVVAERTVFGIPLVSVPVEADGTFRIEGLPPTEYRGVALEGLPAGTYLEGARLGDFDILNTPVRIDGSLRASLDVQLGTNAGSVDVGTLDASGDRRGDMTVVLVPSAPRRTRTDLYQVATSDANGAVRFDAVPPGDYKVFAWDVVPELAWHNETFMRAWESSGVPVFVAPGSHEQASVTVNR
jgi:Carboxypeptidase regulatory-like domain